MSDHYSGSGRGILVPGPDGMFRVDGSTSAFCVRLEPPKMAMDLDRAGRRIPPAVYRHTGDICLRGKSAGDADAVGSLVEEILAGAPNTLIVGDELSRLPAPPEPPWFRCAIDVRRYGDWYIIWLAYDEHHTMLYNHGSSIVGRPQANLAEEQPYV